MLKPSTNDPSYATSSSEIGELHYLRSDKNQGTTVLHQNGSTDQIKKEKMTFSPHWLEKYNLVAERREV